MKQKRDKSRLRQAFEKSSLRKKALSLLLAFGTATGALLPIEAAQAQQVSQQTYNIFLQAQQDPLFQMKMQAIQLEAQSQYQRCAAPALRQTRQAARDFFGSHGRNNNNNLNLLNGILRLGESSANQQSCQLRAQASQIQRVAWEYERFLQQGQRNSGGYGGGYNNHEENLVETCQNRELQLARQGRSLDPYERCAAVLHPSPFRR